MNFICHNKKYRYIIDQPDDWPIVKLHKNKKVLVEHVIEQTLQSLSNRYKTTSHLKNMLDQTAEREIERIQTTPWKIDPHNDMTFWTHIIFQLSNSTTTQLNDLLKDIITRYVYEINSQFSMTHYHLAYHTAKCILTNLLKPKYLFQNLFQWPPILCNLQQRLHISGAITQLRKLVKKGIIVIVPTHSSHLDSIIAGWVIRYLGLPPFSYGTGLNLFNSKLFSCLLGRVGTYKIDRRKRNIPYLQTLDIYTKILLQSGCHSLFYPGGTRMRSGAMETNLKLGLLSTLFPAQRYHYQQHGIYAPKIFIIPMVINYDCVLEAPQLIQEYYSTTLKINNEETSFTKYFNKLIRFKNLLTKNSEIVVSIGEALDLLGNAVDEEGMSYDHNGAFVDFYHDFNIEASNNQLKKRDRECIKNLEQIIIKAYKKTNAILASHLVAFVAFVLLQRQYLFSTLIELYPLTTDRPLTIPYNKLVDSISIVYSKIIQLHATHQIQMAPMLHQENIHHIVQHGLKNLGVYHTQPPLVKDKFDNIVVKDLLTLFYYHNRLINYGLESLIS